MATRNLTKRFVEIRNAQKANRALNIGKSGSSDEEESDGGLLSKTREFKAARESLPPMWVEKIELADEDIARIQAKMRELSALHTKRLMVNFESDEAKQEIEIDRCTAEITKIFRHAEAVLKSFGSMAKDPSISPAERTVRQNSLRSIAKKLQGLSMAFRMSQKEYMSKVQGQKAGGGSKDLDFLNSKASGGVEADRGFNVAQMQMLEDTEELVNTRDVEINKIAKSIEELAQIFKELAVLVIDQGTVLDRIDYNMEQVVENTKEGMVHLKKAEDHQKNSFGLKCIIFLVLMIIIMLIILIMKHKGSK